MKDEMVQSGRIRAHSVVINAREKAVVTGVNDVDSFNENEIVLMTDAGMLIVYGEQLHINKLNLEEGQVAIDGVVNSVEYGDVQGTRGFFGRILGK